MPSYKSPDNLEEIQDIAMTSSKVIATDQNNNITTDQFQLGVRQRGLLQKTQAVNLETEDEAGGLVVIGAGLMRTGTMSLKLALETLLDGPCFHMSTNWERPEYIERWLAALEDDSEEVGGVKSARFWRSLLQGYSAAIDVPSCVFYRELMEANPNARVILTVRDSQAWIRSLNSTIRPCLTDCARFPMNIVQRLNGLGLMNNLTLAAMERLFSPSSGGYDLDNTEQMIDLFESWNSRVIHYVPSSRLLIFDVSQGWEPLCRFLGVPVPNKPFPRVNSTEQFRSRNSTRWWKSLGLLVGLPALLISSLYLLKSFVI